VRSARAPPSGFFLFSKEHRDKVRADLGSEAKMPEVAKKLGEMWRELSESEREKFNSQSRSLKEKL